MPNPIEYYDAFLAIDDPEIKLRNLLEKDLSKDKKPIDIIFHGLVPALESIGLQFSEGKLFLPELIFSGKLMKDSTAWLKDSFGFGDEQNIGTIMLGTVKGDLHDIGKNLVGMMAEGSGFTVIDIGIDVTADDMLYAIGDYKPQIVGLSALLTTTMLEMEKTVKTIKESPLGNRLKIIVGGAPVTSAFAEKIGADAYGKDAVNGVLTMKDMLN